MKTNTILISITDTGCGSMLRYNKMHISILFQTEECTIGFFYFLFSSHGRK